MKINFHPIVKDALLSLAPPMTVLALQLLRMAALPERLDFDPYAHFLGGASIAWGALILIRRWRARKILSAGIPFWLMACAVWGVVALAGVFWEFYEFGSDILWGWNAQINLSDTMGDLFVDLVGGAFYLVYFRYLTRHA